MLRLILARHGETEYNKQGRYQGQIDMSLNDTGRQQAAKLEKRLAQEEIHAIYSSDLPRAWETATTVASLHGLPVLAEPRLREMDFGEWEGLTYAKIQERYPQLLADWEADLLNVAPPGGETLSQVVVRVQATLDEITRAHSDQTVLLLSHGGPLRVLLCLALGLPPVPWQFGLDNASISRLHVYDGNAVLTGLNDTCHLEEQPGKDNHRGRLTLILGGARSGKSTFAQQMAKELGGEQVLFVATAEAGDEEMRERIETHQRERPAGWRTLEAQRDIGRAILEQAGEAEIVLVDCVTMLVSNLLMDAQDPFAADVETSVMDEVRALAACTEQLSSHLVVISNEVGLGLVPPYPLGRAYRDLLGKANQMLAHRADEVYLLIAGISMQVK